MFNNTLKKKKKKSIDLNITNLVNRYGENKWK